MIEPTKDQLALALAEELLADLELRRLDGEGLVYKAARLARITNNERHVRWLHREVFGFFELKNPEEIEDVRSTRRNTEPGRCWTEPYARCLTLLGECGSSKPWAAWV